MSYPSVKAASFPVHSFWHNTGVWQTDRQTDRQRYRNAIANTALSIAARCNKRKRELTWSSLVSSHLVCWGRVRRKWSALVRDRVPESCIGTWCHPGEGEGSQDCWTCLHVQLCWRIRGHSSWRLNTQINNICHLQLFRHLRDKGT